MRRLHDFSLLDLLSSLVAVPFSIEIAAAGERQPYKPDFETSSFALVGGGRFQNVALLSWLPGF